MKDRSTAATTASDRLVALAAPYAPLRETIEQRPRSLSDIAYQRFLDALFARRLTPGSTLSQNELVRVLEVPVAPLRDALRVLHTEGLVTIHPRAGIELAKPDFGMIRNTYQLRTILERAAVRSFAETAPLERIEALFVCQQAVIECVAGAEIDAEGAQAVERIDFGLHMQVVGSLQNPLVQAAYRRAHSFDRLIRLDRAFRLSAPLVIRTMKEHVAILEACLRRDPATAEAALETHFARAMQRAMGFA